MICTAGSSTTYKACPKSSSRGRHASGIASGSIPTAITPSTPRQYGNGGSGPVNRGKGWPQSGGKGEGLGRKPNPGGGGNNATPLGGALGFLRRGARRGCGSSAHPPP